MTEKILAQGAEAIIKLKEVECQGTLVPYITKDRIKKSYRISILDNKLRKSRTKSETKLLEKASKIIPIPKFLETDNLEKIKMQFIQGKKLSDWLDKLENQKEICNQIGNSVAKLHDNNIIHGDLTTSNMILKERKVYFIDFGLGFTSRRIEDKAVDLHLLKQALEAKHFQNWKVLFDAVLKGYNSKDKTLILKQLEKVESRGRYKKGF